MLNIILTWCCVWWLISAFCVVRDFGVFQDNLDEIEPVQTSVDLYASMAAMLVLVLVAPALMPVCLICDAIGIRPQ